MTQQGFPSLFPPDGPRRVLVTGGSGAVGSVVLPPLVKSEKVTITNLDPLTSDFEDPPNITTLQGSVLDKALVDEQVAKADVILHMAYQLTQDDGFEEMLETNMMGTYNIFEAARRHNIKRIVIASTVMTVWGRGIPNMDPMKYQAPVNQYSTTKCFMETMAERYSREFGLSIVALRIGGVSKAKKTYPFTTQLQGRKGRRRWGENNNPLGVVAVTVAHEDIAEIFRLSLCYHPQLTFGVYFALSENIEGYFNMEGAKKDLGYEPQYRCRVDYANKTEIVEKIV